MIRLPEEMNKSVSETAGKAKQVLEEKASVNVIEQKRLSQKQIVLMVGFAVAMVLVLILCGRIKASRSDSLAALDREMGQLRNQSMLQTTTAQANEEQVVQQTSGGLDDAVLEADTMLITENLSTMLTWSDGGMSVVRDGSISAYGLDADSRVIDVFYINQANSSSFDDVTVYCRRPSADLRSYACEVNWTITRSDGMTERRQALFLCSVNANNELSGLDAYLIP